MEKKGNALDRALERLRDLPDSELIPVARELDQEAEKAIARRNKARQEILNRLAQIDAEVLDGGSELVQVSFGRSYEWNVEAVRRLAPEHVNLVEEEVIPEHYEVANTRALNEYIKRLGKTDKARALASARRVTRENPKFKFMTVKGEDEE